MFGWFSSRPSPAPSPASTKTPADADDPALETLAALLRTLGASAPALDDPTPEQIGKLMEGWSEHLLLLRPPPDTPHPEVVKRDFGAVRRFVLAWRRKEVAAVDTSMGNLRSAVWALVRALNRTLGETAKEDVAVDAQLRRLRTAVEFEDVRMLRAEVLAASDSIAEALTERRRAFNAGHEDVAERIRELTSELQDARRESRTDGLTRVANRAAVDEHLANTTELATMVDTHTVLVLVDVDHFKHVNDRYGHPIGDTVLREVAERMTRTFIRRGDFVGRYGGEEFAVILSGTDLEAARAPIERFLSTIRTHAFPHKAGPFHVTASVGAAQLRRGEGVASWMARADEALYQAKHGGRDRAVLAA